MAITSEVLTYEINGVTMHSTYYVDDAVSGSRPGILVFPDARGLDQVSHGAAHRLAEEGYAALACDFYGGGRYIEDPEEAIPLARSLAGDYKLMVAHGKAAIGAITGRGIADPDRIAAIGFCFGGNVSVEIARSGIPLKAAVGFHGGAVKPDPVRSPTITGKVLLCLGASDPMIPIAMRTAFEEDMQAAGVDFRMHIYGGVFHSFTNPKAGEHGMEASSRYDPAAKERSWIEMSALLNEVF